MARTSRGRQALVLRHHAPSFPQPLISPASPFLCHPLPIIPSLPSHHSRLREGSNLGRRGGRLGEPGSGAGGHALAGGRLRGAVQHPRRGAQPPARPSSQQPSCQRHSGSAGASRGWRGAASGLRRARGRAAGPTDPLTLHRRHRPCGLGAARGGQGTPGPGGLRGAGHGHAGGPRAQAGRGAAPGAQGQRRAGVLPGGRR